MDDTMKSTVEVETPSGPVRGLRRAGYCAFLGIPFALPPVSERRFGPPEQVPRWTEPLDATTFGATAQRGDPGVTLIPEPSIPGEGTLNVNVFTPTACVSAEPERDEAWSDGVHGAASSSPPKLPVLVWIHGGGFVAGSPASPWYDGRAFARDGVVTVTLSYRLGFDGFGWVEDAPANRGLLDMLAALEWVQTHIAAFGGDVSRVTIAGQSAGGAAVLTLLGMEASQHLFHAAMALSPALTDIPPDAAETLGRSIARTAGVEPTRAGMSTLPEDRLNAIVKKATGGVGSLRPLLRDGLPLGPTVDGTLIRRPTLESLRSGVGRDKPLFIGAGDDEVTSMVAKGGFILNWMPRSWLFRLASVSPEVGEAYVQANEEVAKAGNGTLIGRLATDLIFRTGVLSTLDARAVSKDMLEERAAPTFAYRFSYRSKRHHYAVHCIDVPFFFDCLNSDVGMDYLLGDERPQLLADEVHGAAVRFIKEGDAGWPAWTRPSAPGTPGEGDRVVRIFDGESNGTRSQGYEEVRALVP